MFDPSKNSSGKIPNNEYSNFKRGTGDGDFLKLFQDPTTLGFKMFFMNIADNINSSKSNIEFGFNAANETPNSSTQWIQGSNTGITTNTITTINSTGLFGDVNNSNSALSYLKSIGDNARFNMLLDFKSLLSKLNTEYPWYFQSIDGLNEAWNRDFMVTKFKKEITVNCLESVDLRITALMDLYRKVAFDWQNRRAILPDNLRKFDLSIKVYDVRNFQKNPGKYLNQDKRNENKNLQNTEFLGEDYSVTNQVTFNLSHCEFIPNESGNMFSNISNSTYEQASQIIKISYENIQEDNIYRSLLALNNSSHYYVRDYLRKELDILAGNNTAGNNTFKNFVPPSIEGANNPNFGQRIQESANELLDSVNPINLNAELDNIYDDIRQNISAEAANLIRNRLNSLYLGNVYDFSPATTEGVARNRIVNAPANAIKKIGNTFDN